MRALSKILRHPPTRSAVYWALGVAFLILFFQYILHSAHSGRQTLGAVSWLFVGLISAGRAIEAVVSSHSTALIAAIFLLAAASLLVPGVRRALVHRSLAAGLLASLFAMLSIVKMIEIDYGRAVGFAIASGIFLIAGGGIRDAADLSSAREWPVWIPLGIAVLFRFWSLAEIPRGFAQHAVVHLRVSRKVAEALQEAIATFDLGPVLDLSVYLLRDQHGPLSIVDGLGFFVFGVGPVEARMTQAVLGCCAVAAAYGLGKALEGPRLGLLFSFLLAVSPWHLAYSRYGDGEHVVPTLHVLLAMLLLVRAVRFGRPRDFLLCGLVVGLSWYFYATNQVVPIIVALFLIFKIASTRGLWKRDWAKLVLMAALIMVIGYPHLAGQLVHGDIWLARTPSNELRSDAIY